MELLKGNSIEYKMEFEPYSNIAVNVKFAVHKEQLRIAIAANIYYKRTSNATDVISSNTEYMHTLINEKSTQQIILTIPPLPVNIDRDKVTKSLVCISAIDYGRIEIDDFTIKEVSEEDYCYSQISTLTTIMIPQLIVSNTGEGDPDVVDIKKFLNKYFGTINIDTVYNLTKADNNRKKKFLEYANSQ